ncbi:hypothetical protein BV25DRAFT_1993147 [Artomyces pyxidatus]|uniref:Uncharacterized protein n=1 Tax=Artomyces pyxidatus TaxID=48021 RepID=A0ACB8SWR4_9AGAM|nr:hypothetical protein BV25DRAFT_1993147 [Artomyces pyxidatus]
MAYLETKPTNGSYDQSLLAAVPDPTRAEKQEGYNVDLLEEGHPRAATPPVAPVSEHSTHAPLAAQRADTLPAHVSPVKLPWYHTKYGIIGIVVALLVVIGAVVGGAVGGTRHHKSNTAASGASGNGQGVASTGQGIGTVNGGGIGTATPSTTSSAGNGGQAEVAARWALPTPFAAS